MSEQQQHNPAEIDLLYFFKPVGYLFKITGLGIAYCYKKIMVNKFLFAFIIFIISCAGFSLRYIMQPAFQTEGMFVSNTLPAKYCSLLLENLNQLRGEKNNPLLAKQLNIPAAACEDILSINMLPLRDTFTLDKRDSALSLFRIKIILKKMNYLDTIQWGLANYLENNEYALKRKEAKKRALQSLRKTFEYKLESLDSLKKIVNNSIIPRSEGKGIILGEPVDPISVYQAEVAYYREQLNIDQALATIDNIEIIQPFIKINQYNYPRFNKLFIYSFLLSLAVAGFIVLLFGKDPK